MHCAYIRILNFSFPLHYRPFHPVRLLDITSTFGEVTMDNLQESKRTVADTLGHAKQKQSVGG